MAEPKRRPADHDGLPMCSHLVCPKFVRKICTELGCEPDAVCVPEAKAMVVEIRRMRPVYETAKSWREKHPARSWSASVDGIDSPLVSEVDIALAKEKRENTDG